METTWRRDHDGWRRGDWLVRKALGSRPEAPLWEMCKTGADGNLRVLDEGPTARGMMDHADISDGL
jgi:hypothetical protein